MDQAAEQPASSDVLDQDVGCPECGYNLRGLGGDIVTCPECGQTSDVAVLLIRRWDKPWYKAPRYSLLCLPAATAFLAFLGWVMSAVLIDAVDSGITYATAGAVWMSIGLIGWCAAMAWVWNKLDQHISAGFALLAHLPIVGYIGGLILVVGGLFLTIRWIADDTAYFGGDPSRLIPGFVMFISGIIAITLARLIERLAAKHCIRLYLRRPSTSQYNTGFTPSHRSSRLGRLCGRLRG